MLLLAAWAAACTTHAPAALAVDSPLLPYQAPDVDELTGEDELDAEDADATDAGAADRGSDEDENKGGAESSKVDSKQPATPAKAGK